MSGRAWSFRTTTGVVTVHDDAITTRSTPGQFLAGQSRRWRHGDRRERLKAVLMVGAFLVSIVGFAFHLYLVADTGLGLSSLFYATSVGFLGYSLWHNYGRATTIPRSALESISLDADSRELTVTHRTEGGPLSVFRDDVTETKMRLSTGDEVRKARETFRLRGLEIQTEPIDSSGEITHRIVSENGGHYCERCQSLVTPNDKVCPSCEYVLWVEASQTA